MEREPEFLIYWKYLEYKFENIKEHRDIAMHRQLIVCKSSRILIHIDLITHMAMRTFHSKYF